MSPIKVSVILLCIFFAKFIQAAEDNLYDFLWLDPDKAVYVLQHKIYEKRHSFYLDFSLLSNSSSEFQDSSGFVGNLGYYWAEEWGVELSYSQYSNKDNAAYLNVTQINGSEPFVRRADQLMNINVIWSPFYGKINTFNKIIYFDWRFGIGIGKIDMESNIDTVVDPALKTAYTGESYSTVTLKSDLKVYINKHWQVQLGVQDAIYQAPGPRDLNEKTLRHNVDIFVGIGFSF